MQKARSLRQLVSTCFLGSAADASLSSGPGGRRLFSQPSESSVWSFGDGSHGALGLPLLVGSDVYEPTRVPDLPSDVRAVCAGHYHSLAVTSAGEIWAWGRNDEGQLGRGQLLDSRDEWSRPGRVQGLDHVRVRSAFASGVVSMAVGDDGSLWAWGRSKRGQLGLGRGILEVRLPTKVEALAGEEVAKVGLGWGHALAQTKDGKLYGWGYSAEGRLGKLGENLEPTRPSYSDYTEVGKTASACSDSALNIAAKMVAEDIEKEKNMPIVWEPCQVPELHGLNVMDVACGHDHSLVLCCTGLLLSGGSNVYNQLGRVPAQIQSLQPIDLEYRPYAVSCGLGHSLALCLNPSCAIADATPSLFSWGWNLTSQLGRGGREDMPSMVEALKGKKIKRACGGRVHSVAVSSQGEIFSWGSGRNGRLGLGSSADEPEPTIIEALQGLEVLEAVCGHDHNLVLVAE
ncbi:ultraviolet-B receptor UVR8 [Nymphaea colorata]|nr:ultraviolet-B receptor UVR8 [Nymphaea colorata]